jgi:hypothetical protein
MVNKKIGALWKHKKDGETYLVGNVEIIAGLPTKIAIFINKKKQGKQPDYNIVLSIPKQDPKESPKVVEVKDDL